MSVEVKRKTNESPEALIRRFSRKMLQSGVLYRAKQQRFYQAKKNKRKIREDAKRRRMMSARREYLIKTGKLTELDDRSKSSWSSPRTK